MARAGVSKRDRRFREDAEPEPLPVGTAMMLVLILALCAWGMIGAFCTMMTLEH